MLSALHFMVFKSQAVWKFLNAVRMYDKRCSFLIHILFPISIFEKNGLQMQLLKKSSIETIHAFSEYKIFKQKC